MKRRSLNVFLLGAFTTLALCGVGLAGQTIDFGRDDDRSTDLAVSKAARDLFLSRLSTSGTESFEAPEVAGQASPPLTFIPGELTGTTQAAFVAPFLPVTGSYALLDQGPQELGGAAFNDTFLLSKLVTAFGLFISQSGDRPEDFNTLTMRLTNTGAGSSKDVPFVLGKEWGSANGLFIGITDTDPFDKIEMIESLDFDGTLYDDVIAGFVVPEPTTCGLLSIGATLALLARWRRRRARS